LEARLAVGVSVKLGSIAATATPIEALAASSCASAASLDGRLTGSFSGRCSEPSFERLGLFLGGEPAEQCRQHVPLHRQLLLQWRQCCLSLGQRRLDGSDVGLRQLTELQLLVQDVE
jgi:hypothetical protein